MLNDRRYGNEALDKRFAVVCDLSRPVVPEWLSWLVILTLCIEMSILFAHRLRIFESLELSMYFSLWNYVILAGICLFYPTRLRYLVQDKYFILIVLFFVNCAFVDYVSAHFLYKQPLLGIVRTTFRYGGLWVYPLLFMVIDDRFFRRLINILLILGLIGALFTILLALWPNVAESLFNEKTISERLGRLRLPVLFDSMVYLIFFYSYVRMVKFKNIIWGIIWCILFFVIFYIEMTRQIMLSFLGAMLLFVAFHLRFQQKLRFFCLVLVLFVVILSTMPVAFDRFVEMINSFIDVSAEGYGQISVRQEAIAFYWEQFQKTDYVGFGRISITHGGSNPIQEEFDAELGGRMFIDDLGLLGSFFQYGFGLLLIVVFMLVKAFKNIHFILKHSNSSDYVITSSIELLLVAEIIRLGPFFTFEYSAFIFSLYFFIISFIKERYNRKLWMDELMKAAYPCSHAQPMSMTSRTF
jgi:hypothetical protein